MRRFSTLREGDGTRRYAMALTRNATICGGEAEHGDGDAWQSGGSAEHGVGVAAQRCAALRSATAKHCDA